SSKLSYFVYVFTLGMLCAFAPMCSDLYLPSMPSIMDYFQTTPSLVQSSLTASFLGLAIGQLIIGPLSDAYGRILPLYVSLVIFTVTSFFCAISDSVILFIVMRLFQGISAAGGIVLTRSIACDKFKGNELTSFMAFLMSINSLAPILAPIIGSFIISFAPWQMVFYVLVVWGILLIIATKLFVPESLPQDKRQENIKASLLLLKVELLNPKFMLVALSLASIMGGFFSYLAASPFVFQVIYGMTPFEYSCTFAFISICISITGASAGRVSRRFGEERVVKGAYLIMFTSAALMLIEAIVVPSNYIFVLLTLAVYCSMMAVSQAAGFGIVMSYKKGGAGAASGLFGVLYFLFGSMVSPFVGIMGENSMLPLGINLLSCVIVAIILLKIALSERNKHEKTA
ncbi:MAG: multidrug effflux MFS transporter, partial [Succinivibrio sp.]|nr:multidrug effflux MFS transporter [Succinivibrio sp.]